MSELLRIRSDRILTPDGWVDGVVTVEQGKITSVIPGGREADLDYTGRALLPGFIDMHTHGAGGHDFLHSSPAEVLAGCNFHLQHGTTTILPTISAAPFADMRKAVADIAEVMESGEALGNILGAHMEGPYLSAAQCGAQCPDFITEPREAEYRSLMEEFGKYIARWTYAPENDPDGAFARYLSEKGVLVSAGHTDAKYPDMVTAIENGCSLITHLYSCTSTITRDHGFRSLGVIESAYLRDELFVEIIADGKHLPADLLRLIVKLKGKERVALITDSLAIAGTDVTEGIMGATEFIVEDGVCKLQDRSAFAGSVATADRLVEVMVREAGFSLFDAVEMLTRIPAKILGLSKGQITPGYDADLVVMDDDFSVQTVFVAGKLV